MDQNIQHRGSWDSETAFPWFIDRIQRTQPGDVIKFREGTENIILTPKIYDRGYETPVREETNFTWGDAINTLEQSEIITLETPGNYRRTIKLSSQDPQLSEYNFSQRLSELLIGRNFLNDFVNQTLKIRVLENSITEWFQSNDIECFKPILFDRLFYNFPRDSITEELSDISEYISQLSKDLLLIFSGHLPKKLSDIVTIQEEFSIDKKVEDILTDVKVLVKQHDLGEKNHTLCEIVQKFSHGTLRAMRRHMILNFESDKSS